MPGLVSLLQRNRAVIERELQAPAARRFFTPAFYAEYQAVVPRMGRYLQGRVIDLGCGNMPFRSFLPESVSDYDTLEATPRPGGLAVTYVGDIQNMPMVPSAFYDGALCFEVLEHIPEPGRALQEIARILKPGGLLLLTVPHLSRLHDEPHDYFRFTHHALAFMLSQAGFEIVDIEKKAGLFSFVGHQLSTFILSLTWGVPVLKQIAWIANKFLLTLSCYYLDLMIDRQNLLPIGYVVLARKPLGETRTHEIQPSA